MIALITEEVYVLVAVVICFSSFFLRCNWKKLFTAESYCSCTECTAIGAELMTLGACVELDWLK